MLLSALRCTLSYIVFPFVLPVVGITAGLNSTVGFGLSAAAIAANAISIHRFWSADHRYKVPVTVMNVAIIVLLVVLVAGDMSV